MQPALNSPEILNKHFIHCWFQGNRPPGSKDKSLDLFQYQQQIIAAYF